VNSGVLALSSLVKPRLRNQWLGPWARLEFSAKRVASAARDGAIHRDMPGASSGSAATVSDYELEQTLSRPPRVIAGARLDSQIPRNGFAVHTSTITEPLALLRQNALVSSPCQ
jgi:hypothetical protein